MKVRDVMIVKSHLLTVNSDVSLQRCGEFLETNDINGIPVLEEGRLVGVITRADIFTAILPRYPKLLLGDGLNAAFGPVGARLERLQRLKAKDLMSQPVVTTSPDVLVLEAGSLMIRRRIKQLPVTTNKGLVGIVTLTDICRAFIAKGTQQNIVARESGS